MRIVYASFEVLCIFLLMILLVVVLFHVVMAISYWNERKNHPQISFDQFKRLYQMNNEAWDCCSDDRLAYNYTEECGYTWVYFRSYLDLLRYRKHRRDISRRELNDSVNAATLKLVQAWQKDIDNFCENTVNKMMEQVNEQKKKEKEDGQDP